MRELLQDYEYRIINIRKYENEEKTFKEFCEQRKIDGRSCEFENIKFFYENKKIKSVIVIFIPYMTKNIYIKDGNISMYARGEDYHIRIEREVRELLNSIESNYKHINFKYQCDIGVYNERFYAGLSGLCIIGDNGTMINPIYGSYGNLVLLYTDYEIDEYITPIRRCIGCGICAKSCPTNSISRDGITNANTCISYITQKKGLLTFKEEEYIKNSGNVFGCDICQKVCVHNQDIIFSCIDDDVIHNLNLEDISSIGNKEFIRLYKNRAFSWRGKAPILRNLKIIFADLK